MARRFLSVRVDLVEGRGTRLWPRPGRLFAAAPSHTFAAFGVAVDAAFARWDLAHLREFRLADGTTIIDDLDEEAPDDALRAGTAPLRLVEVGAQFLYVFDFGDDWHHLCTVEGTIDPMQELGTVPQAPTAYFGWGDLPDQYGRTWADDDGEAPAPPDPRCGDLPPFFPWWGDGAARYPD